MNRYEIPRWMVEILDELPKDRGVGLLIRHSVREKLSDDLAKAAITPITSEGWELSIQFGRALSGRVGRLYSSPLIRCRQTVSAIALGSGLRDIQVRDDAFLGDMGIINLEFPLSHRSWVELGYETIYRMTAEDGVPPDGFAPLKFSSEFLLFHLLSHSDEPGVHLFCTHDYIIMSVMGYLLNYSYKWREISPKFQEGLFVWREGNKVIVRYRDHRLSLDFPPHLFTEENAYNLGKWYINQLFRDEKFSRFVIAGGAFKTLITGKLPRDIDIWPYLPEDRTLMIGSLLKGRGFLHRNGPFTETFSLRSFDVEINKKTVGRDVGDILERFDIGLSAVGIEFIPSGDGETGEYRLMIRPEFWENLNNKELSFIKPLKNWPFAFTCLERIRRQNRELGFKLPPAEEDYIFNLFLDKTPEERQLMLENLFNCKNPQQIRTELKLRGLL